MGGSGSGYHVPMGMLDIFPMADGSKAVNDDGEAINGYDRSLFFKNRDPLLLHVYFLRSKNGDMIRMQMP